MDEGVEAERIRKLEAQAAAFEQGPSSCEYSTGRASEGERGTREHGDPTLTSLSFRSFSFPPTATTSARPAAAAGSATAAATGGGEVGLGGIRVGFGFCFGFRLNLSLPLSLLPFPPSLLLLYSTHTPSFFLVPFVVLSL